MESGRLTAIAKAMGAGKSAIDITKSMADLVGKTQNAELINQMAELRLAMADLKSSLADAKGEVIELQEENNDLKKRVQELENPTIFLTKEGRFYKGQSGEGLYCPQCWEGSKKLSLISDMGAGNKKCSLSSCSFRDLEGLGKARGFVV